MQASCGRKPNYVAQSHVTISTLFNQFMFYLFEICNQINAAIYHTNLEEIFLLKYAIFALSFINKLDSKLDRKFYWSFWIELSQRNLNAYLYMLEDIHRQRQSPDYDQNDTCKQLFPPDLVEHSVYHKSLDSLFDTYLANHSSLVTESIKFNVLPLPKRTSLINVSFTQLCNCL